MTSPGDHRVPLRTCIGCRTRRPQTDLARCVLGANERAHVDRHAPGRGAWLCGVDCFELAVRRRAFERAWRSPVHPGQLAGLGDELERWRSG